MLYIICTTKFQLNTNIEIHILKFLYPVKEKKKYRDT